MKFNIAKQEIVEILNIVLKGIAARSSLPILAGVLIEASQGELTFQTTDLEISIKHTAKADILEEGKVVIAAKLFSNIVRSLPDSAILVESKKKQVNISCENSFFSLSLLDPADFPYFPNIDTSTTIRLPAVKFCDAVKRVAKAVSKDESRQILTGILFSTKGNEAHFTSTDSFRLSTTTVKIEEPPLENCRVVIPGKIFENIIDILKGEENITIGFSENQAVFTFGQTVFVSRKIEGNYPNLTQLIPKSHSTTVHVDTVDLYTAIKRVSLLLQGSTTIHFAFSKKEQNIILTATSKDVGGAREIIPAQIDGEEIDISFNYHYILDGITVILGNTTLELQDEKKPVIFKDNKKEEYLYLVMPIRG